MDLHNLIRRRRAQEYFQSSAGCARLGAVSLPVDQMVSAGTVIAGRDLTPPQNDLTITPGPLAIAKLRDLHEAAGHLAEHAPEVIANAEAARGLEQALVGALVGCLATENDCEDRSARRQHAKIMRRFFGAVEESAGKALYVPELCKTIAVSERTLRVCCQEHLRMSPKRYLILRRMHLANRALRSGAPTATSVTEVATQYGFWQFGRFAAEYKSIFGELPSHTMARSIA